MDHTSSARKSHEVRLRFTVVYVNIRRHLLHDVGIFITPVGLRRLASLEVRHSIAVLRKIVEGRGLLVMLLEIQVGSVGADEERTREAKQQEQIADTEILQMDGGVLAR